MRTPRILGLILLLILGPASARGGEGSGSTVGDLKLPSGPTVVYDYHFDRNAFADSVDLPGGLVALTRSGNLIRFDPETRKPTREWFGPSRITCMGQGEPGSALIGFEDGRVARLDPATLEFKVIATLPGQPHWVGTKAGGGAVAVVERWKWFDATVDGLGEWGFPGTRKFGDEVGSLETGIQEWHPYSEVHDLGSGRSCAIGGRASAVYLDRKDRVWFGAEYGEFGGWCRCVDLSDGQARVIQGAFDPADEKDPFRDCVYGFIELRDERILALGGVMHDFGRISIHRVDGDRGEVLLNLERGDFILKRGNFIDNEPAGFGPGNPDSPIVLMLENGTNDSLLAVSEDNSIYRTDPALKRWDLVHQLGKRPVRGPGDVAEQDAPNIRAVHPRREGLLCATDRDGYVLIAGGREARELAPHQLEARKIDWIDVTPEGPLFCDWSENVSWYLRDGRWTLDETSLSLQRHKFTTPDGTRWGFVFAVEDAPDRDRDRGEEEPKAGGPKPPLERFVEVRWQKAAGLPGMVERPEDRSEYLENGEMVFGSMAGEQKRMRRRDGLGFPKEMPAPGTFSLGDLFRVVNEAGSRWMVFNWDEEQLFALSYGPEFRNPRLVPIALEEAGLPLKVYDAISWSREEILIATRKGQKLCDIATGQVRPAPLPSPERAVKRLARDGSGRLWLGGEGLWMVDGEGRLHDLAPVPMVGRSEVVALARDAGRRDGVIVSLGTRGVAFLRVEPGP